MTNNKWTDSGKMITHFLVFFQLVLVSLVLRQQKRRDDAVPRTLAKNYLRLCFGETDKLFNGLS